MAIKKRLGSLMGPRGRRGPQGLQGNRGLPGPDALPADEAVSTYIMEPLTASRAAVEDVLEDSLDELGAVRSQAFNNIVLGADPDEYLPPGTIAFYYTPTPTLFTDFSGGTVGEVPDGWSRRWNDHGWGLEAYGDALVLAIDMPGGEIRSGLAWDEIQEVPGFDNNGEIVFKWRSSRGTSVPGHALLCGSGDIGAESGYYGHRRNAVQVQFGKLDAGVNEYIGSPVEQRLDTTEWLISRVRKQGDRFMGKTWLASDPEPQNWQTDITDTDFTTGWWGLIARGYSAAQDATLRFDWVGFATGDHTAPKGLA